MAKSKLMAAAYIDKKKLMKSITLILVLALITNFAFSQKTTSTNSKPIVLVELFTSEGCSSCPPADALVEKQVATNNSDETIYLSYHVDYWDHLGWKDAFSKMAFTSRQRKYAQWLDLNTIYTPQMVVNGHTEFTGSQANVLKNSLAKEKNSSKVNTLTIENKQTKNEVAVILPNTIPAKSTIILSLVKKHTERKIGGGENMGRLLKHTNVVVSQWEQKAHAGANNFELLANQYPEKAQEYFWVAFCQNDATGEITALGRLD